MSSISNRFFVSVLEDGTTLHGNLSVDGSLTQAWNGTSAVPNWEVAANQPTIKLTLLNGVTPAQPDSDFSWYYNGTQIDFNSSVFPNNAFQKTTVDGMPSLKIVKNLASTTNVDMDTIEFRGAYHDIEFSATAQIRISAITANGYLGTLAFENGISDITEPQQKVKVYASLYGGSGNGSNYISKNDYSVVWYINEIEFNQATFPNSAITTYTDPSSVVHYALNVDERDITDHATIRCEFIKSSSTVYNAFVGIDDMQDPEFMYIQFKGANGNAASLRSGESVTFYIWVGKTDDPTVDESWSNFELKLLDAEGEVMMNTNLDSTIPNPDANGWRGPLGKVASGTDKGKAYITISYSTANDSDKGKKNLTGILRATTGS